MRRLVALLALLIPLVASAAAHAHVTKPGFAEIRQHGDTVNFVLGLETDPLVAITGEGKEALAAYMTGAARLTVDGESCRSRMTRADAERHNGTAYTRIWLFLECPQEQGEFRVEYDLPME